MNEQIKTIIAELCELDPELKAHEAKLEKIIVRFLESRPDTKFDEKFARELKAKIMSEPVSIAKNNFQSILSMFSMKQNYYILSGVLAVLVIAVVAVQMFPIKQGTTTLSFSGAKITRVASRSFGSLVAGTNGNTAAVQEAASMPKDASVTSNVAAVAPMAFGRGGGGGGTASAGVATDIASPSAKMMIYRPYQIKYVYKGEEVKLTDKTLDVLKRIKPKLNTSDAVSVLNKYSFGGVNLESFNNNQVASFELSQPDGNGYLTTVNLREGMVSISQNYYAIENSCPKGICPVYVPLRPSDMPEDSALIKMSNDFLKDHGVSLANYGEAKVENDWRKSLETSEPNFAPYVPDVISVVYPQKINGVELYDLGGGMNGIRVNVDVRQKRVTGAWNILTQDYEAASYEAETDSAKVLKVAQNGGIYGVMYADPNAEVVEVELGTPKKIFANMWKSDGTGEVVVPALYFPVTKSPKLNNYYVQNGIIVPLVKELLQVPEPGPIQIMDGGVAPTPAVQVKVQ